MVERISQSDESFVRCYGIHAQRYAFASEYCQPHSGVSCHRKS